MQELVRRVDPAHRTLGRFFRDEVAVPLGVDFFIGLPPEIPPERLASVLPFSPGRALRALPTTPWPMLLRVLWPWSLLRRSFQAFPDVNWNDRRSLEVEVPAGNGVGTARAIARLYSAFAEGGGELGVGPETMARITAEPTAMATKDIVMGVPSYFSLGFLRPGPDAPLRLEPPRVRRPGCRRLVRLRGSGRTARLRLRHEQDGLLHVRRSAGEGSPRRPLSRDRGPRARSGAPAPGSGRAGVGGARPELIQGARSPDVVALGVVHATGP